MGLQKEGFTKAQAELLDSFRDMIRALGIDDEKLGDELAVKLVGFVAIWDNDPNDTCAIELAKKKLIDWFKQNYRG